MFIHSYDQNGKLLETARVKSPSPVKLMWDLDDPKLKQSIDCAYEDARKIIDVIRFCHFLIYSITHDTKSHSGY
jgi:hypothetical protein